MIVMDLFLSFLVSLAPPSSLNSHQGLIYCFDCSKWFINYGSLLHQLITWNSSVYACLLLPGCEWAEPEFQAQLVICMDTILKCVCLQKQVVVFVLTVFTFRLRDLSMRSQQSPMRSMMIWQCNMYKKMATCQVTMNQAMNSCLLVKDGNNQQGKCYPGKRFVNESLAELPSLTLSRHGEEPVYPDKKTIS